MPSAILKVLVLFDRQLLRVDGGGAVGGKGWDGGEGRVGGRGGGVRSCLEGWGMIWYAHHQYQSHLS